MLAVLAFWAHSGWAMQFLFSVQGKVYLILRVGYFLMPIHSEVNESFYFTFSLNMLASKQKTKENHQNPQQTNN